MRADRLRNLGRAVSGGVGCVCVKEAPRASERASRRNPSTTRVLGLFAERRLLDGAAAHTSQSEAISETKTVAQNVESFNAIVIMNAFFYFVFTSPIVGADCGPWKASEVERT